MKSVPPADPAYPGRPRAATAHRRLLDLVTRHTGQVRHAGRHRRLTPPALPVRLIAVALAASACSSSRTPAASEPSSPPTALTSPGPPPSTTDRSTTDRTTTSPSTTSPDRTSPPSTAGQDWTTYQAGPARLGVAPDQPTLTPVRPAWSATLDGAAVYAQPLLADHRVIVATEDDNVYALNPHDGSVEWRVQLGTPLRNVAGHVGCGDIDPLGITSTPVVDPARGLVYAVGEVSTAGAPPVHHELAAIDIRTGAVVATANADPPLPPGGKPLYLLQREALALGNGRVYIGYGGHYGDCGIYHGWLVAVPAQAQPPGPAQPPASTGPATATATAFDVTPSSTGGAIWDGGAAPAIGSDGSVYVTTGNPNSAGAAPWAEAAVKLPPALGAAPLAAFQDRRASGDLDLATGGPVLLPDVPGGEVFVTGKTDIGYRLRPTDLSLIEAINGTVCGSDPDGGAAFDAALDDLYVPCRDGGIQQVDLRRNATGWRSGAVNSTPILAGGSIWALSYPSGTVQELDPATGHVLAAVSVGRRVPTFASPSAADGLLLVPTDSGVVAFSGPGGPPPRTQG